MGGFMFLFKRNIFFTLAIVMTTTFAFSTEAGRPNTIIGKFKVIKANCGGESFLWKKQDKIISVGGVLFVKGHYVGGEDFDEDCRYEARYRKEIEEITATENHVEEVFTLKAIGRKVYCFSEELTDNNGAQKVDVKSVPMEAPLSKVTFINNNGNISFKMSEFELCDGEVTLELAHDRY
jgi:hypothetical protein